VRSVRLRILIPRARRLSTCISRATASFVGLKCGVVTLRGRKRGHFGEKVIENDVLRFFFVFYTTFSPKWPRLRPRSATTPHVRPTKLAVSRDIHVDRRRVRGIRIRGGTARTTARCHGAGRKTPIGTMVGQRGRRSASNFGDFDDFGANFLIFFQHHHPQHTSTACRGCEVEH